MHDVAAMPLEGGAPILAVQAPTGKFAPVTVMVLPTYAAAGYVETAVAWACTYSAEKRRQNTRMPILIDCIIGFYTCLQQCFLASFWPSFVDASTALSP